MNGQVAYHYGHLVDRLWRGPSSIFSPKEFKFTIGRFAPAFNGYSQHDAQEFLSFLLDGLHEDLNRIQKKPYVEHPEPNGRPERELADEAWELHKKRNDSIVVDLFHGLYRSQLHCPECDNISIKFDPFMYLTLPIPYQSKIDIKVLYIPPNELSLPGWIDLRLLYPATGLDMKKALLNRLKLSESGKSLNSLVILQVKNDYYSQSAQIVADVDAIGGKYAAGKYFIYHLPCEFPSEDHVTVLGVHAVGSKDDELDADETNTTEDDASMNDGKHGPYGRQSSYYSNYSPIKPFGIPMLIPIPIQDAGTLEGVYRRLTDASQRFTSGCLYKDYIPPAMESESEYTGTTESELVEGSTGDSLGDTMDEDELTTFIPASSDENDITEDEDAITEDEDMSTGSNKKQRVSSPNPYTMHYSTLPLSVKEFIPKPDMFKMKKCIRPSSMHLGRILERELELLKPTDGHTFTLEGKEVRSLLFDGELVVVEWLPTVKRILFGDEVTMDEPRPTSSNFNSAMPYGGASDEEDTPVDKPKAPTRYKKPMVSTDISHMSHLFNTYETYTAPLGPDPQGQFSLRQCLQEFAKEEQLGPSEAWYCPKCKKHQQAMKKMSIWKLPKVLVVHLKRFESRSNKIDVPVDFPIKDLSLDDWVAEEALKEGEEQDKTYDLFGIVNHVGQLYWGHYTAYAKNFANNRWYHFNDSFTEEVRDVRKTIQTRQAYLLFYKQREDTDDLRTEIPEPSVSGTTVHGISNTIYSMNMSRTSLAHGSRSDSLGHAYNPRRHANSPTNSNSPILQPGSKDSNMTEMTDSDGEHGWDNLSTKYGNSSHMSMEDEDHFLNDDYIQVSDDEDDKETRARDAW
jgi:ubiquitin carboxyl-terminal hydrolase 4/11/15